MDFEDTPEEAAFRSEAYAWLDANAEPRGPDEPPRSALPEEDDPQTVAAARRWQATKAAAGWSCLAWPPEYGGRGGTPMQQVIWNQEEGRYRTPPNLFVVGTGLAGPTLIAHASGAQCTRWLPKLASRK